MFNPDVLEWLRMAPKELLEWGKQRRIAYLTQQLDRLKYTHLSFIERYEKAKTQGERDFILLLLDDTVKDIKALSNQIYRIQNPKKGAITDADIDAARQMDIVSTLQAQIPKLTRAGSGRWKAPCLWHEEKTPSMVIYSGDKGFHCFGCGKSGDTIDMAKKALGVSFVEAVKYLIGK